MVSPHRRAFVEAAEIALALAASAEVKAAWDAESACAGMSVGGLAHHLVSQAITTAELLATEPGIDPIPMLEHYERAAWVKADLDDEVNVSIREGSDERAAGGPDAVLAATRESIAALPGLLDGRREPDVVLIPWQGWSLTTDDFLTTRMMEIVVHSDDLAASVDLPTPTFPDNTVTAVLGLLTGVAVRRHGQAAVVRALSRPQRAPDDVSAF
ncbi:MAG: maleylpyruvate isomerase N-terminal domain-containing protein [Actinomycetota bacterium]|nr:maleylpyruvate isomerase N-terminal domain-containing protein [Actinomycetota bacterium]